MEYREGKKEKLTRAVGLMKNRLSCRVMNAWTFFVCRRKEMREKMTKALKYMQNRATARAWHAFCDGLENLTGMKSKALKALGFFQKRLLAMAWSSWMFVFEEERKRLAKAFGYMFNKEIANAINTWRGWLQWKKNMRENGPKAAKRWRNGALSKSWNAWRDRVNLIRTKRDAPKLLKGEDLVLLRYSKHGLPESACRKSGSSQRSPLFEGKVFGKDLSAGKTRRNNRWREFVARFKRLFHKKRTLFGMDAISLSFDAAGCSVSFKGTAKGRGIVEDVQLDVTDDVFDQLEKKANSSRVSDYVFTIIFADGGALELATSSPGSYRMWTASLTTIVSSPGDFVMSQALEL
mmetsp:Transcript_32360/g.83918  ORF Transcript_32360/g.83918 Transcript_32360/m.83918 type:complete len:349 (-) Transcript_32360:212-1258(-)